MTITAAHTLLSHDVDVSRPGRIGLFAIAVSVGAILAWSELAPIASAVIASGIVVVESNRRVVQHADGGIIRSIAVRDGDRVLEGDVLLTIDDTRLKTARSSIALTLELNRLQTERLKAEQAGSEYYPSSSISSPDPTLRLANSSYAQFHARRASLQARIQVINSERSRLEASIPGIAEQISSQTVRLQLTEVELRGAALLAQSGAGTKQRVIELAKARADIESVISGLRSQTSELRLRILHSQHEVEKIRSAFTESVESDLQLVQREKLDLEEKITQVSEQISRTRIVSPVDGTIVNLAVHTIGGVISPGSILMEIVPENDNLLIESQIRPEDADGVHAGASVDVRVSGSGSKRTKRLLGTVAFISADRVTDRLRGNSYFMLRAQIPRSAFETATERTLYPGMPVELFVNKGQRTVFEYLVGPLIEFFSRSFKQ